MIGVESRFGEPSPTEEELKAELVTRNQELAEINSEVGRMLAAQRHAEHLVREVGKALQLARAKRIKSEMAAVGGVGKGAGGGGDKLAH